jgi:AraC-like DNA-binding protein
MAGQTGIDELLGLFHDVAEEFRFDGAHARLLTGESGAAAIEPGAHFHRHWELRLVLRGAVAWPDDPRRRHPRCLIVTPETVHHAVRPQHQSRNAVMLVLTDLGVWQFNRPRGARPGGACRAAVENQLGGSLTALFETLQRDALLEGDDELLRRFWAHRLRAAWLAFLMGMYGAEEPTGGAEADLVERACRQIETSLVSPDLTVAEIARACGCTPTHLAHAFRRRRGRTVRQTLIERRLARAYELLRAGYLVKEAAYLTGWRSVYHFSNTFLRQLGYRPSEVEEAADTS